MTSRRNTPHDVKAAAAQAAQLVARKTCEGCASLPRTPRPMCTNEGSPHYRQPRHTGCVSCSMWAPVSAKQMVRA